MGVALLQTDRQTNGRDETIRLLSRLWERTLLVQAVIDKTDTKFPNKDRVIVLGINIITVIISSLVLGHKILFKD